MKNLKEYWKSRLHIHGEIVGKLTKKWTHRKERRKAKELVRKEINEINP